jgi:hypothetical protein
MFVVEVEKLLPGVDIPFALSVVLSRYDILS